MLCEAHCDTVGYIGSSLDNIINIDPLLHILTSVLKQQQQQQQQQQQVHKEMLRSLSDDYKWLLDTCTVRFVER